MSALKEALIIHPAVEMVPFEDLTEELRESLKAEPGDMALSRGGTRSVSRIIDLEMAALLLHFRTATRVPHAVLAFATELGEEPTEVLKEALPILSELHAAGVLATELELSEPEHMTVAAGDQLAGFEIVATLQAFADSAVFRVRHRGELAILKVAPIDAPGSMDPGFANEAARLRDLAETDFVPALLASGTTDGYAWILIEHLRGISVNGAAERLRADADLVALSQLGRRVAEAYAELHDRAIVHGDVHPNNILVDADNRVHLIDFGVSRRVDQDCSDMGRAGVAFFTEPEVAQAALAGKAKPGVTTKSEQYTVAAVLYELVTGSSHRPQLFNHRELLEDRATNPAQTFSDVGADVLPSFEAPLLRALAIDPAERFDSMADFADALARTEKASRPGELRHVAASPSTTTDLKNFADRAFEKLDPDAALYSHGLSTGPKASVALGSAGIAYALVRQALRTGAPDLLMQAEAWLVHSQHSVDDDLAWTDANEEFDLAAVSPASTLHREAGHDFVECLIAAALGRPQQIDAALNRLLAWTDSPAGMWDGDLTIGPLSLVPALAQVRSIVPDPDRRARIDQAVTRLLRSNLLVPTEISATDNVGLAHGAVGRAYAHLIWERATGVGGEDWSGYLGQALRHTIPSGRGANIPWNVDASQPPMAMPGWCNGAAGVLTALTTAASVSGEDRWLGTATGFAWHCYEARESGHDLCCGTGGRAYALAEYGIAANQPVWVDRATKMIARSLTRSAHADPEHNPSHSLIKGDLGLALLIRDLETPDRLSFPVFGSLL